ncbi:hypothetical protein BKA82DRAFT_4022445 [Pisolithus tinctorius]|nr:hypothetical protein BKA82DRAFT_4022445 [Pisolithus tinctorius]
MHGYWIPVSPVGLDGSLHGTNCGMPLLTNLGYGSELLTPSSWTNWTRHAHVRRVSRATNYRADLSTVSWLWRNVIFLQSHERDTGTFRFDLSMSFAVAAVRLYAYLRGTLPRKETRIMSVYSEKFAGGVVEREYECFEKRKLNGVWQKHLTSGVAGGDKQRYRSNCGPVRVTIERQIKCRGCGSCKFRCRDIVNKFQIPEGERLRQVRQEGIRMGEFPMLLDMNVLEEKAIPSPRGP